MTETKKREFRNICFTLNNYTNEEEEHIKKADCRYIVFGKEIGEEGTPHLQGYIEFWNSKKFHIIKKILGERSHIEPRKGSASQAAEYCKKQDKNFFEKGTISRQGQRKDLEDLRDEIIKGKKVDEIVMEEPIKFHQYGRTLERIETICNRKKFRTWMTKGIWYWGKTGVGKSTKAFENYNSETHYVLNLEDNGWWDGYSGQEIVIMNEFRGQIKFNELLDLTDKYPKTVKQRGKEPVPFLAKTIIITSCKKPEEIYRYSLDDDEKIDQLIRRFDVIELERQKAEVVKGNTSALTTDVSY